MGLPKCTEILSGTCPSSHLFGTCKQHQIIFVQIPHTNSQILTPILDLQSIPRELNNKDVAAMLVELMRNLLLSSTNMAAMTSLASQEFKQLQNLVPSINHSIDL